MQIVDSAGFMGSSLSNLVNNLSEGICRVKWKFGHNGKKSETCTIKSMYCDCFPEYANFKDDLIEYKCLHSNKNCQLKFDEKRNDVLMHANFPTKLAITLLYCCMFSLWIYMNDYLWMKHPYPKKKNFTVT